MSRKAMKVAGPRRHRDHRRGGLRQLGQRAPRRVPRRPARRWSSRARRCRRSPTTSTRSTSSGTGYAVQAIGLASTSRCTSTTTWCPTQAPIPMLASGQPTWSSDGKSLTVPIRDRGQVERRQAVHRQLTWRSRSTCSRQNPKLYTAGAPAVTSATATSATSVTLNFAQPQIANQFSIAQVYIVPQHVWSKVGDPATFSDANPVGTGPFMLDHFSPQGFTLKQNPSYWNKASVHVPEISFPAYNSNFNLIQPVATGRDRLGGQRPGQHQAGRPGQEPAEPHLPVDRAVLRRQQRRRPGVQHDQEAAERPGRAPGHQPGHQPAAAVGPGRDVLRAAGDLVGRPDAADRQQLT